MKERLLVIGGDAAGMSAASQARRRRTREELEVVAFERGAFASYAACGLPYLVSNRITDPEDLIARTPAEHRANGVDVHTHHEVVAIDTSARELTVRDLDAGAERTERFDQLVVAMGAVPIRPDIPGVDADGVHGIQTLGDGIELRDHLIEPGHGHQRAVVVGAGYIGIEMAEAMHQRGLDVTVVHSGSQPMTSALDADMGELVAAAIRTLGIDLRLSTTVEGFETDADGHVRAAVTTDGTVPTDIVVLGIGVKPNIGLARAAGIEIGDAGGIATDPHMATNIEGVWAAGDCVQTRHRVTGKPAYVPLGTHANKQGRVAGTNATGGRLEFPGVVGTAITKIYAYEVGRTGLTEREATDAGFDHVAATIEGTTRAAYYPDTQPITVKTVAERGEGRLLGAQIIGREGAAKRIDLLATAIWAEMTVDQIAFLDLGYAPPFSPVWDPTIVAARVVSHKT